MKLLKLFLTVPEKAEPGEFQVNAEGQGGQIAYPSRLPFFQDETKWRSTIIKILGAVKFRPQDFPGPDEQTWMLEQGLLVGEAFSQQMQQVIGQGIYAALFPNGPGRDLLQRMLAISGSREQLHIQLEFSDKVERRSRLADYPWELAHDQGGFLVQQQVVFSRYIGFVGTTPQLPPVKNINVLLVSSSAGDQEMGLEPLGSQEQKAVLDGLQRAAAEQRIQIRQLTSPTWQELGDYLTENTHEQAPHIIHFDGHGFFGQRCDRCRTIHRELRVERCRGCGESLMGKVPQGYLLFKPREGQTADYISAMEVGSLLHSVSLEQREKYGVRLMVMSACKTGFSLASDTLFNGVAQSLIQHQVPAVLAMQYNVTVDGATAFADRFYRALGNGKPITTAVRLGQQAMGIEGNQWYRPVLYLRWYDNEGGQLFADLPIQDEDNTAPPEIIPPSHMNLQDLTRNGILNELVSSFNNQDMANLLLDTVDFPGHLRPVFPQSGTLLGYWQGICRQIQNGVLPSGNDLQLIVDGAAKIYPTNLIFRKYSSQKMDHI
jgi:hypothetical protein